MGRDTRIDRLEKKRKKYKKIILILLPLIFITITTFNPLLSNYVFGATEGNGNNSTAIIHPSGYTTNKVVNTGNIQQGGVADVTLTFKGPENNRGNMDVVFAIDMSKSMGYKGNNTTAQWEDLKPKFKALANDILTTNPNARIGLVFFSGMVQTASTIDNNVPKSKELLFTNKNDQIANWIDTIVPFGDEPSISDTGNSPYNRFLDGSNISDGLLRSQEMLNTNGREDAKKLIVLFGDGPATVGATSVYCDNSTAYSTIKSETKNTSDAIKNNGISIFTFSKSSSYFGSKEESGKDVNNYVHNGSIFSGDAIASVNRSIYEELYEIDSGIDSGIDSIDNYQSKYFSSRNDSAPDIFANMKNRIIDFINTKSVTDYIDTTKFEYLPGTYKAVSGTKELASVTINDSNKGNESIGWKNIISTSNEIVISYKIKVKDTAEIGNTITNPGGKKGVLDLGYEKDNFNDVSVTITEKSSGQTDTINPIILNNNLNENPTDTTDGKLETKKSASDYKDDKATITLDVLGKASKTQAKKADIVIIIDKSGSMSNKISEVQNAAKNFSENILNNSNGNVRIAVGSFNYVKIDKPNQYPLVDGSSSTMDTGFTSDLNAIKTTISSIKAGGGTNTQDGIWRAENILEQASPDANKYVVFFTDGLPTQWKNGGVGRDDDFLDSYFKAAQKEYYNNFIGYGSPTSVTIGGIGKNKNPEVITVNNPPRFKDVKFYTVGLITNNELDKASRVNFLKTIQNAVESSKYEEKYYTENISDINSIFMDISNEIKESINPSIAKNVVIKDIVTKEFGINKDSVKIIDLLGNEIKLPPEDIVIIKNDDGCYEITLKIGEIIANTTNDKGENIGGVKITFDISARDPYFSGQGIKTNVSADVIYTTPTSVVYNEKFKEEPTVNISRKEGRINITKNIKDEDGNIIPDLQPFQIVIQRKANQPDDPKNIVGYDKAYTLKSTDVGSTGVKHLIGNNTVSADGKEILSTKVENKEDYLIAGEYIVKEINIPTNYDISKILINNTIVTSDKNKYQGTFTLSKDNPNINIEVINKSTAKVVLNKTAQKVDNRIYEVDLVVNSNGIKTNNGVITDIVADEFEILQDNFYNGKFS
ncbi:MAG: vWA domain-containing protein, partial [Clostridium sp.]